MKYHVPALLKECMEGLNIKPDGKYVDVTFGAGGHSRALLERLGEKGRLYAFDQDEDAKQNLIEDDRFFFIPQNFKYLKQYMRLLKAIPVDGIIADLGVSSYQFDTAERGFSTRYEGELDMRMSRHGKLSAKDVVNHYSAEELQSVFSEYGEVRNARTLSQAIVRARQERPITTTSELKRICLANSRGEQQKYLAQVFQAIRIEVNKELDSLQAMLRQSGEVIAKGGRLCVITYHSLEDRLVKNYMKHGRFEDEPAYDLYGKSERPFSMVHKKPVSPLDSEVHKNPRVRSAKLRIAEKTGQKTKGKN